MQQSEVELQIAVLRYHIKQKRADYEELQVWRAAPTELEKTRLAIKNFECELEFLVSQQNIGLRYSVA